MKPAGNIIIATQASSYPSFIDSFLVLCMIKGALLVPDEPLQIFYPSKANGLELLNQTKQCLLQLSQLERTTMNLLLNSIS